MCSPGWICDFLDYYYETNAKKKSYLDSIQACARATESIFYYQRYWQYRYMEHYLNISLIKGFWETCCLLKLFVCLNTCLAGPGSFLEATLLFVFFILFFNSVFWGLPFLL